MSIKTAIDLETRRGYLAIEADVAIVGGGLFGSVIAAKLKKLHHNVVIIDSNEATAGSKPAACLMKPTWFSSLGKDVYKPALETLDELFGVQDIRFKLPIGFANVHWCDPSKILCQQRLLGEVTDLKKDGESWLLSFNLLNCENKHTVKAKTIIFATGVWTNKLFNKKRVDVKGLAGAALLIPKEKIEVPFIRPWAPYKQIVAFNRGDGLWVGDGTSIKAENWNEERENLVKKRCLAEVISNINPQSKMKSLFGIRPYTEMKPCFLKEEIPGLWIATGGAKNGTLAAGWCAYKIAEKLT